MIKFKEITCENFWEVIDLSVAENQEKLVTSNAVSIAQSKVQPECIPLAVYVDDEPVGFAMYCIDRDEGEYWIYRLMIDKRFQGRGYGKTAAKMLVELIQEDKSRHKIFLGVHLDGGASVHIYKSLGFEFDGQVFGSEHIMCLSY